MGLAVSAVTDISLPAWSEQRRELNRIGFTISFSCDGLATLGMVVLPNKPRVLLCTQLTLFQLAFSYVSNLSGKTVRVM